MCQECGHTTLVDLLAVHTDRLVKRCRDCGHTWNEERVHDTIPAPAPVVRKGGWIWRDKPIDEVEP